MYWYTTEIPLRTRGKLIKNGVSIFIIGTELNCTLITHAGFRPQSGHLMASDLQRG